MKIPQTIQDFIATLRPVRKPSTCAAYFYKLRGFHTWLSKQRRSLESLDRPLMERWLQSLADRALAPSSRATGILNVRSYLGWLFDQGKLTVPPDDLLRSSDIPKIPNTLPKPYPKEIDQKLQRRFLKSGTLYGDALFLMRHTGVRIGELVRLVPDCLEIDLHGNAFMRVPLGKLDNERLVPLDRQTRKILEQLQTKCQDDDPFLLESHYSRKMVIHLVRQTLKDVSIGMDIKGPIITHRLRHTYATELLNAGMGLFTIMKLLGHRCIDMTLRYAAITQETVVKDYLSAMERIANQYKLQSMHLESASANPQRLLIDTISWLRNYAAGDSQTPRLIKRIYKIHDDIARLTKRLN